MLSYYTSNQTPVLQYSVKRPLFIKLYNNSQWETPTPLITSLLAFILGMLTHTSNQTKSDL